jgi:hypothetical protein
MVQTHGWIEIHRVTFERDFTWRLKGRRANGNRVPDIREPRTHISESEIACKLLLVGNR